MKKTIIIAGFILLGFAQLNAQVSFRPGLRAGVNFSGYYSLDTFNIFVVQTKNPNEYNVLTNMYLGLFGTFKLTKLYSLRPEINYFKQGAIKASNIDFNKQTLSVSYWSFSLLNKITILEKFNVEFGPTLDFVADNNFKTANNFDLALTLGTGYNLNKNITIEGRFKGGFIPVFSDSYDQLGNYSFSLGAAYTFDIK